MVKKSEPAKGEMKKKGLKALASVKLPAREPVATGVEVKRYHVDDIEPDPGQPRRLPADPEARAAAVADIASTLRVNPATGVPDKPGEDIRDAIEIRKMPEDHPGRPWRIFKGERRWTAAKLAGFSSIPGIEVEIAERDVLREQLLEFGATKPLTPLEMADAVKRLVDAKPEKGHRRPSLDYIAERIGLGKLPRPVHEYLALASLGPVARAALAEGRLASVRVALELAGIAEPEEQAKAAEEVSHQGARLGMATPRALEWIRSKYHRRLAASPFDTGSATLVPSAGACSSCPHNTATQAQLFAENDGDARCTKPRCWAEKLETHREIEEAKGEGKPAREREPKKRGGKDPVLSTVTERDIKPENIPPASASTASIPDPPPAPSAFSPLAAGEGNRILVALRGARASFAPADWAVMVGAVEVVLAERPIAPGAGKPSEVREGTTQPERDQAAECRVCRCTEDNACEGGCSWTSHTAQPGEELCSSCAGIMQMIAESASDDADGVTREELEDAREEIFESEDEDEANAPSAKVWAAAIADMLKTGELRTLPSGLLATRDAAPVDPAAKLRGFLLAAVAEAPPFNPARVVGAFGGLTPKARDAHRRPSLAIPPSAQALAGARFSSSRGIGSLDPEVAQAFRDGLDARIIEATAEKWLSPEAISGELEGLPVGIVEAALERLLAASKIARAGTTWCSKAPAPAVDAAPAPGLSVPCPACFSVPGSKCTAGTSTCAARIAAASAQLKLGEKPLRLGDRVTVTAEGAHKGRPGMIVWMGKGKDARKISVDLDKRGREKTMPHLSLDVADVQRVEPEPEEAPVAIKPAEIPESREHITTYLAELAEAEKKRTLRGRGAQEKARLVVTELDSIATAIRGGVHAPIAGNEVDAAATYLRASARVVEEPLKTRLNSAAKAIEHGLHLKGTAEVSP
jgi:ParB/RepB/Spo0J family partition protein